MIFERITLANFRQYFDRQRLEFTLLRIDNARLLLFMELTEQGKPLFS